MKIITLLTDFGLKDCYVAAMKGMILNVCSDISIVDITHETSAFDVQHASMILYNSYFTFPEDTVHVCVVDPGVGSQRDILVISDSGHWFIGPDNGIFSMILQKPYPLPTGIFKTPFFSFDKQLSVNNETMIWKLKKSVFESRVSATFHGRDIFAPMGALLCCPEKRERFLLEHCICIDTSEGNLSEFYINSPFKTPTLNLSDVLRNCSCQGDSFCDTKDVYTKDVYIRAVYLDNFGNIVTDIFDDASDFDHDLTSTSSESIFKKVTLKKDGNIFEIPFTRAFADVDVNELLIYKGSSGLLEIGVNNGNAAERLNIKRGDCLELRFS